MLFFRFTTLGMITLLLPFILVAALMCWIGASIGSTEISFVHTDTRDIYSMDVRLGISALLLKDADASAWLGWSHDGNFLAFTRDFSLHILNVTDGSVRNYPVNLGVSGIQEPAWSPDDRFISFHAQAGSTVFRIYFLRLSDGMIFPMAEVENFMAGASWSPVTDGTTMRLAYQSSETSCGSDLYLREIQLVDDVPTTTNIVRLTNCGYQNMRPEWSPDGQQLLFYASLLSEGQRLSPPEVYMLDVESGEREQVTILGNAYYPTWSADGTQIVFTMLSLTDLCRVYIMDADGDNLRCLSRDMLIDISAVWRP